jgi:phosphatidate cytidylyltransferase
VSPLAQRILSALVMLPPVAAAVWFGPPWSDLLVAIAVAILAWEWSGITAGRFLAPGPLLLAAGLVAAIVALALGGGPWALLPPLLAGAGALLLGPPGRRGWLALGALYLGPATLAFAWLRHRPDGLELIGFLLATVWAVDIFAYVAGRAIGGPKLWPAVSPKKTWAGLIGGVLAAALAGAAFAWWLPGSSAAGLALASALLALVAQGGDLLESAVKRRFGVKDASRLIPGHGGLMDRVDGLLAASLALAAALWLGLL